MNVGDLLESDAIGAPVTFAGGVRDAGPIHRVTIIERLGDLDHASADSLCVCTGSASLEADTYRIDVAIRNAASRRVRGMLLKRADPALGPSAVILAERAGIGLLTVPPHTELGELVLDVATLLRRGLDRTMIGAGALLQHIDALGGGPSPDFDGWATVASTFLRRTVTFEQEDDEGDPRIRADILAAPEQSFGFATSRTSASQDTLADLTLRAMAHRGSVRLARRYAAAAGERTLASVMAEILLSDQVPDALVARAAQLGVRMEDTHIVVRFHAEPEDNASARHLAAFDERAREVVRREALTATSEDWRPVAIAETITYAWSGAGELAPTPASLRQFTGAISAALDTEMGVPIACGVGGAHADVRGLRASAAEARAALSHARQAGIRTPVLYDSMGLRRMLLDWTTGDAPRRAFERLLRPLDSVSANRRDRLLDTVIAVFEEQGSATAAGRALDVHRNTIDQRLAEVYDRVDLDPDDPDHRLMLYLAARSAE